MCKYHTVFLTADGQVYTCGHGQGGRLGHGDEQTYTVSTYHHTPQGGGSFCYVMFCYVKHNIQLKLYWPLFQSPFSCHFREQSPFRAIPSPFRRLSVIFTFLFFLKELILYVFFVYTYEHAHFDSKTGNN